MKKLVSIPKLKKKAQIIFNEYIRLRDAELPCISCSEYKPSMQAGHFYAVGGYDGLRFDEFNCNIECPYDNCFNESHLIGYGENLLLKIGQMEFDLLKIRASDYKKYGHKWRRSELEEIIKLYTQKLKDLT